MTVPGETLGTLYNIHVGSNKTKQHDEKLEEPRTVLGPLFAGGCRSHEVCSTKMQWWSLLALADLFVINRPHTHTEHLSAAPPAALALKKAMRGLAGMNLQEQSSLPGGYIVYIENARLPYWP